MDNIEAYANLSVGNYISIFYRIGSAFLSQRYESYNIGFGQYQFLIILYFEDGLSQDELTKRVSVDKATTTRAISKLKEQGYVQVNVDKNDKRIHRVCLTDKARLIESEVLTIAKEWEDKLLRSLTPEDQEVMTSLFHKIATSNGWLPVAHNDSTYSIQEK